MAGNREYKSDVFSMLMEDRKNALQVYNAVNDSHYDDPELVEICSLDRGISLSIQNDAAFVLDASLSLYEHQSTVCPNMPLRSLLYVAGIWRTAIKKRDIFGRKLIKLPTPKFVVFYNGTEDQPEQYDLKLSDAFERQTDKPELELTCRVYNINQGKNREFLEKCPVLREYMTFVGYVRENLSEMGHENLKQAINMAIDRCIEENVLREFLIENRAEVVKVEQLDYTFERRLILGKEESREEGLNTVFDIMQKLKDGESKESLIGQGYEENVVDRAYTMLFN
jgi:hypothetical protein